MNLPESTPVHSGHLLCGVLDQVLAPGFDSIRFDHGPLDMSPPGVRFHWAIYGRVLAFCRSLFGFCLRYLCGACQSKVLRGKNEILAIPRPNNYRSPRWIFRLQIFQGTIGTHSSVQALFSNIILGCKLDI